MIDSFLISESMFPTPNYQITQPLYDSDNTLVYRAIRLTDQLPVILKWPKTDTLSANQLARYEQEYELLQSLHLPNVIKVYGLEKWQGRWILIMEDMGGVSLKEWLTRRPFTLTEVLTLAIQIADGLGQLHALQIIHKDINPNNLIWNPTTGQLKFIDFGIATRLPRERLALQNPNQLEGTLPYLSPEQTGRMNRALDYRTDLYSLGVSLYELITGRLPFDSEDAMECVHCHLAKAPLPLTPVRHDVPPVISCLVLRLMAKAAEERYQSAWGLKADLEKILDNLIRSNLTGLTDLSGFEQFEPFELGQHDFSEQFHLPQKLYGREAELQQLLVAFEKATSGHSQLLLVAGYSGIGKTAVVQEIYKPITEKRGYFITGKFDQFQRNVPYSAVVQAFGDLMRQLLTESQTQLDAWKTRIIAAVGNNGQVIVEMIPEVEWIIGPPPPVPSLPPTESQNRFNWVFQNFIKVFSQPTHPLVIFLDDLQWIDSASLKLMTLMMTEIPYLLLIGAYRDNEVSSVHPLMTTVAEMQKQGRPVQTLILTPLTLPYLNQLVSDTLHLPSTSTLPLAKLVTEKTGGNPFFVGEFLKTLYSERLLDFNRHQRQWQWNLALIQAHNITDNVVELMTGKILRLKPLVQQVLTLAAVMGNQFDLTTLSVVSQQPSEWVKTNLWEALIEGLVVPMGEKYKFVHDRVQQAAYSLIPESDRPTLHWQIGQLLWAEPSSVQERLFEVVDHLNLGKPETLDSTAKMELARLNLQAGQKARQSAAYESTLKYLEIAVSYVSSQAEILWCKIPLTLGPSPYGRGEYGETSGFLPTPVGRGAGGEGKLETNSWQQNYDFTANLYKSYAEAEFLNSHFEQSAKLIGLLEEHVITNLEKAEVLLLLIVQKTVLAEYHSAIDTGKLAFQQLGLAFPSDEHLQAHIQQAFAEVTTQLAHREISSLVNTPDHQNPVYQMAIKILVALEPVIYIIGHLDLYTYVSVKTVAYSLQYGNIVESAKGYANYGLIVGSGLGDFQTGYQFGRLALEVSKKFNSLAYECKSDLLLGNWIHSWSQPLREAKQYNLDGYHAGMASGEMQFASYNIFGYITNSWIDGTPLAEVQNHILEYLPTLNKAKNDLTTDTVLGIQLTLLLLTGQPESVARYGKRLTETEYRECCIASPLGYATYCTLRAQCLYILGRPEEALSLLESVKPILGSIFGFTSSFEYNFYHSLVLLALIDNVPDLQRETYLQTLTTNQAQLKKWADNCPNNFLHRWLLVEAELARVTGNYFEAVEFYDHATELAGQSDLIQNHALANELAGQFWIAKGHLKYAKIHLIDAYFGYQRWGASAKLKHLEQQYPQWLPLPQPFATGMVTHTYTHTATVLPTTKIATTRMATSTDWLDLVSVMKASQALSGEIILKKLLDRLMHIVIENAGAQRGFLLLPRVDQWVIEAHGEVDQEEVTVLQSLPLATFLPETIINYVIRTLEPVVLAEARRDSRYAAHPYIQAQQIQSVLCFPILHQQQLRAILYLENNLTCGAFTPDRLHLLTMLSGQIAISLENAQVMAHLDTKVKERTAQLNAKIEELTQTRQELVQSEIMASLGRLVAGFAHELNTPLGVALGSASALQTEAQKIRHLLAQEEVDVDELLSAVTSVENGFTLTLSNLERAANLVTSFKRTAVDQTSGEMRVFQVLEVIEDTINTLHTHFKPTSIEIQVTCPPKLQVNSLPGALEQILTNLLMNSLIHGFEEGHRAGQIQIVVQRQENRLHLEYSDNGKGIAPANLAKVFEPFFTTHRAHGGSGLGMYICYNLVTTQLQGTIMVDSVPSQGVIFRIDYPILV